MEHPLLEDISGLTLEEIQSKISDLNKKMTFAYQSGNQGLIGQIQLVLGSYNEAYRVKMEELMPKGDGDKFANKIDIGK